MKKFDLKVWLDSVWQRLPAKHQRGLMVVLVFMAVVLVLYVAASRTTPKKPPQEPKMTRQLFGGQNKQQFAVMRVGSQLEQMERENKELRDRIERLTDKKAQAPVVDMGKIQADIARQVQEQLAKHEKPVAEKKPEQEKNSEAPKKGAHQNESGRRLASAPVTAASKGHDSRPWEKKSSSHPRAPGAPGTSGAPEIKVVSASSDAKDRMQVKDQKKKDTGIETFIPAGSIFSGTLITGLDVSCGKSAKKDPFPVLLRVKKEAIMPNMYRADVRECFLIAAGWGDLGSERAYLRAERLSCIREDGKAIETKIDMYAVGEDGKAGVRGRLVSKTGALLSRALLAGFMQGFSQIFTKQPVLQIGTGPAQKEAPFQSMLSKDAMQSASLSGTGSALERLSKYYLDMAKDIFPVIEIDAGRAIDFIMISGKSLKLQAHRTEPVG